MKKALIAYFSQGGTTRSVSEQILRGLHDEQIQVDLYDIAEGPLLDINSYDMIGIGSPAYIFRPPFFEQINQTLIRELKRKHQTYTSEDIFAEYKDICVLSFLHLFTGQNRKTATEVFSPYCVPRKRYWFKHGSTQTRCPKKISFSGRLKVLFGIHFQQLQADQS